MSTILWRSTYGGDPSYGGKSPIFSMKLLLKWQESARLLLRKLSRGNVNVQHFTICKNLIFTLSPSQTWVILYKICMIFLDPLKKYYFCISSSKLGPLWCLSSKFCHPCPFGSGYVLAHFGGQICFFWFRLNFSNFFPLFWHWISRVR